MAAIPIAGKAQRRRTGHTPITPRPTKLGPTPTFPAPIGPTGQTPPRWQVIGAASPIDRQAPATNGVFGPFVTSVPTVATAARPPSPQVDVRVAVRLRATIIATAVLTTPSITGEAQGAIRWMAA